MEYLSCLLLSSILFLSFISVSVCSSSEFCYTSNGLELCEHGCCGSSCCVGLEAWMSALIAIVVIGFVVTVVIVIVVCIVKNSKVHNVRVVHPQAQPNVTVVSSSQTGPPSGPPPAYGTVNPGYGSSVYPPPPQAVYTDPFGAAAASSK